MALVYVMKDWRTKWPSHKK